jgi:outer membrane lipoprotein SlyB
MVLAACLTTVWMAGCSTAPADYLSAADDQCQVERQDLKSVEDHFNQQLVQGAVIGAVGGAATGALLGFLAGGDASSAAIGAGAGALAGGLGGYFVARQQAYSDRNALVQTVYDDVSRENVQIDRTTAAYRALRECRLRTAESIRTDFAAGRVSRGDAEQRLARTRELFRQDIAYAEQLGGKMEARNKEFAYASDQLLVDDPTGQAEVEAFRVTQAPGEAPGEMAAGPSLVANTSARLRETASTQGRQVATLAPGETVTLLAGDPGDTWWQVRTRQGETGFVSSKLLSPPGTKVVAKTPPKPATTARKPAQKKEVETGIQTASGTVKIDGFKQSVNNDRQVAEGPSFALQGQASRPGGERTVAALAGR